MNVQKSNKDTKKRSTGDRVAKHKKFESGEEADPSVFSPRRFLFQAPRATGASTPLMFVATRHRPATVRASLLPGMRLMTTGSPTKAALGKPTEIPEMTQAPNEQPRRRRRK